MINLKLFSRIFVGLVFIFSGFVKGVDPLGTAYRIEDYFIAYGTLWAMPWALILSIALSTLEIVLGTAMVLNARIRFMSWILFSLMIFFTILTFFDALYNPVLDCGCFGDFIKLSNWQTFFKNIVLIIFVYIIFKNRRRYRSLFSKQEQTIVIIAFIVGFGCFSFYQYNHLPMCDFRDWKIGNDMKPDNNSEPITYLIYKNKESGEKKEYISPNFPWNDSIWMSQWVFIDQRIDASNVKHKHDLIIQTLGGSDITESIIKNPDYQFIFISDDLMKVSPSSFKQINKIYSYLEEREILLVGLTSSSGSDIKNSTREYNIKYDFFFADDIVLKAMIRSNPGLILLQNGVVMNKWHYHDFPTVEELKKELRRP
jgi:uncharacterized membrane protein YphA (DoxX/SURF4 family)